MKRFIATFSCILVFSFILTNCAQEDFDIPKLACTQPDLKVNQTVAHVQTTANAIVAQYPFDDIIEAYVVSSDEGGNFFKTISFQTLATPTVPAVGFSVPVDVSNLYIEFRLGNKVYLQLKNQYTDIHFGGLRIGAVFVNSYNEGGVGRLSPNEYRKVLFPSCAIIDESQLTKTMTIPELLNDANLNTLVELQNVQFTTEAVGRKYYEESEDIGGGTNWNLMDQWGNQVIFRTSSFADFSSKIVPKGSGKVKGVLSKFGTDYQLIARSEKDVNLTGASITPFFKEDFEKVVDKTNLSLPGWANLAQKGTPVWKGTVYNGNGYAEFAISGTKVVSNVAWLISPKIDLDTQTKEILTFRSAQHHLDVDSPLNTLDVFISSNFDGVNVATATWIPLPALVPKQATPWYQFIGSGAIDLSSYKGKVNIAFRYTGSGKNAALDGAFMVDDVQFFGDK
ncbi:DUF5689 domain-containing protein [Flavobacterium sp. TSSA_36]|uniref:DUF5689 domain-containing protein n=1 Tax=Flavobacterium sp. TSSA_36 TaxID=3447669 RepID=UPI003F36C438